MEAIELEVGYNLYVQGKQARRDLNNAERIGFLRELQRREKELGYDRVATITKASYVDRDLLTIVCMVNPGVDRVEAIAQLIACLEDATIVVGLSQLLILWCNAKA